jgi:hypothetical protein
MRAACSQSASSLGRNLLFTRECHATFDDRIDPTAVGQADVSENPGLPVLRARAGAEVVG